LAHQLRTEPEVNMSFHRLRNVPESGADRRLLLGAALLGAGWFTVSVWCVYALSGLPASLANQPRGAPEERWAAPGAGAGVVVALVDRADTRRPCACAKPIR
jgi:hypothetical protein